MYPMYPGQVPAQTMQQMPAAPAGGIASLMPQAGQYPMPYMPAPVYGMAVGGPVMGAPDPYMDNAYSQFLDQAKLQATAQPPMTGGIPPGVTPEEFQRITTMGGSTSLPGGGVMGSAGGMRPLQPMTGAGAPPPALTQMEAQRLRDAMGNLPRATTNQPPGQMDQMALASAMRNGSPQDRMNALRAMRDFGARQGRGGGSGKGSRQSSPGGQSKGGGMREPIFAPMASVMEKLGGQSRGQGTPPTGNNLQPPR